MTTATKTAETKTANGAVNGDAMKAFEDVVASSKQTAENVMKVTSDAAAKGYEKAVAMSQEQVEAATKAGEAAMKRYEDLLVVTKDTVDAMVKSGTIMAKGWQDVTKAMMGFAQSSVEDGFAHTRAVSGVKSVHELIELNQGFAKTGMDKAIAETNKLSELSLKVVEEASVPLNGRVEIVMDKLFKPVAV